MHDKQKPLCDLCLSVMTGDCSDEERLAFERHLPGCEACRAEWNDLQLAWGRFTRTWRTSNRPRI
ncbi:zf-HC2 domain-containing protein [Cohnella ginsengisoli]|uniref:Anti-sigma-W factor RsiW n=1 Tax=Cohnella ginsengisoli TaxID=425004 RepID=A0A9X4KMV3_9BACL|nr:zf-HC2 domain-containing protein [Cohnella ginsengisoli]MDG0795299.1 zf-HC2 domain-containing protein [Cohnella ginsengisoli]